MEAGTYAANGMGKQSPIILAVTNKDMRDKISCLNGAVMGMGPDADPQLMRDLCDEHFSKRLQWAKLYKVKKQLFVTPLRHSHVSAV